MSEARACSKCEAEPVLPGQRWGAKCKRASRQRHPAAPKPPPMGECPPDAAFAPERENGTEAGWNEENGAGTPEWEAERETPPQTEPAPKRPGPRLPDDWQERFLQAIKDHGGYYAAAKLAGIAPATFWRHYERDQPFAEEVRAAREEHADKLENEMAAMGRAKSNPVSHIVLLKKYRPAEYIERHAVMSLNVAAELPGVDAVAILRDMLQHVSPTTRALLEAPGGPVIDLPALPEADSSR